MARSEKTKEELLKDTEKLKARVTELETAQSVYRQEARSAKVFRTVADKANSGVMIADLEDNLVYVNKTFAEMHGYSPGEIIGKNLSIFYSKDQIKQIDRLNKALEKEGSVTGEEIWHKKKDGTLFPAIMNAAVIKNEKGKPLFVSATMVDITGMKLTEDALRESEQKYRLITENASDYIAIMSFDGTYRYISPSHAFLGYDPKEMPGKNGLDMIHPEDRKKLLPLIKMYAEKALKDTFKAEAKEVREKVEFRFPDKDGNWRNMEATATLIRSLEGRGYDVLTISRDITERKAMVNELRVKEDALSSCVNAVAFSDLEGKITYVNDSFVNMWGYSGRDEIIGRSVEEFWVEKEGALQAKDNVASKGGWNGELAALRKDGSTFTSYLSATLVKDKKGKPACFFGSFVDITELKETERSLRESEERFKAIFDNALDGIVLADAETKKLFTANMNFCKMLGYTIDELKNISVMDVHPKEDLPRVLEDFGKQARKEMTLAKDIPVKRKDGSVFYADVNSSPVSLGDRTYLIGIFRDVTKRKRMQARLKQSKEFMDNTINAIHDPVFVKDEEHRWVILNDSACKLMGRAREELIGKNDYDIFPKEQAGVFWEKDDIVLQTGQANISEEEITWHDKLHTILTVKSLYKDSVTGKKYVVGTITDITDRKNSEMELRRQKETLDVLNKELSRRIEELQVAMRHIKRLEGLVPICAKCKRIRAEEKPPEDPKAWVSLEAYITEKTDASLTHGLCPECAKEMAENSKKRGEKKTEK